MLAPLRGDERALDVGCGTGALSYALAPLVGAVVGVDSSAEYVAAAQAGSPENCTFVEGDAEALPFPYGDFDLVGCLRVLHHAHRPELVVSELARVVQPGGRILLADQLGDVDPLRSLEQDRFGVGAVRGTTGEQGPRPCPAIAGSGHRKGAAADIPCGTMAGFDCGG